MAADGIAPDTSLAPDVLSRLRGRLGAQAVLTGSDRLLPYRSDEFPTEPGTPLAAVRPGDRDGLAAAVGILAEAGVPFVPRGAGSGLAGGAVPREAVVVSTEALDRVLDVDPRARRAVVEPGVVTADVSEAARPHGLRYLPDPASHEFSSIGGNVATAAGGPHCLRHGVTSDHVTRIEVVLPDGRTVTLTRGTDGGLDLAGLFVGSEGTLGVASRIEVRLVPRPPAVRTALALFDSLEDAGRAVSEILERVVPVALELMDGPALEAVEQSPHAAGLPTDVAAALIVETEGFEEEAEADLLTAGEALAAAGARDVLAAADKGRRRRLWKARREAYHALEPLAPDLLVQDMTVPRSALPDVLPRVREIAERHGLRVVNFFHAGDGNLHPNLLFDGEKESEVDRVHRATAEIAELCVEAGGTITGEHGVGVDKKELMQLVFSPVELELQRAVKGAFDPAGLCNPGKVLPDPGPGDGRPDDRRGGAPADVAAPSDGGGAGAVEWLAPASVDEMADVLRRRDRRDPPLPVTGAARPPSRLPDGARAPAAVLSTAALSGVLEHRPGDLTVTVAAGTRMADFLARMSEEGSWLPFGGPSLELSVGGAVASSLPGPFDAGHGDLRRQLLACGVVTPGGDRVRWGRGVMKNVAGYGMTRVVAGSRGRLGAIHSATFRLWPAPASRRRVRLRPDGEADALEIAGRIAHSDFDADVRPDAVVWRRSGGGEDPREVLEVRLTGTAASVELRLARLRSRAEEEGADVGEPRDGPAPLRAASDRASGPFGRRRTEAARAAWIATGRRGFARAARAAGRALGGELLSLEGYPLSGDLRCAWTGGDGAAARLLEAVEGVPVRLERGTAEELAAAERRREPDVRRLDDRVAGALGGRARGWLSGYL